MTPSQCAEDIEQTPAARFGRRQKNRSAPVLNLSNVVRLRVYQTWSSINVNIGQAAKASGISAKMIRYYESIDLFPQVDRTPGGYREYETADVQRLRFIRQMRNLGFSLDRIRELVTLWSDQNRRGADVKSLALVHIAELQARAAEVRGAIKTLRNLVRACDGDQPPGFVD